MSAYAQLLIKIIVANLMGMQTSLSPSWSAPQSHEHTRTGSASLRAPHDGSRVALFALDEDLEAALTHLEQALEASGARVTHDPLPTLPVDRGQIVRLFQNLIGNALKYRQADRAPKNAYQRRTKGTEWIISIRDNGIGFDPKYAATIFLPFKRLHTAEEYPGTGVGTAICRRIMQAQGGRIWAESQPGEGTTFFFTLPVDTAQPLKHTPPIDTPRPRSEHEAAARMLHPWCSPSFSPPVFSF